MDNSTSERAIRSFTVSRKTWALINTVHETASSAIIYSLVETAKVNNLKPYNYPKYLPTEIPRHMEDTDLTFLEQLLPRSPIIPQKYRKPTK